MALCRTRVFRTRVSAQRLHGVVSDKTLPYEGPQCIDGFVRKPAARTIMNRGEKRSTMFTQVVHDFRGASFELRPCGKRRTQPGDMIGEVQRDAAVAFAERLDAHPDDFARTHECVEHRMRVVL